MTVPSTEPRTRWPLLVRRTLLVDHRPRRPLLGVARWRRMIRQDVDQSILRTTLQHHYGRPRDFVTW